MIEAVSGGGKRYIFKGFSLQGDQVEEIATSVINMITSKLPEKARSLEVHLFILDFTKELLENASRQQPVTEVFLQSPAMHEKPS